MKSRESVLECASPLALSNVSRFAKSGGGPPHSNAAALLVIAADHTRIKRTRGGWTIEPTSDGGSDVTYVVCSEPGGSVPAWLVARAQRDEAMKFVKAMLDRARLNLRP